MLARQAVSVSVAFDEYWTSIFVHISRAVARPYRFLFWLGSFVARM